MILRFQGLLEADTYGNPQTPKIDGRDVLDEITTAFGYEKEGITVGLGNEAFSGKLDADGGSTGYSSWTPGENARFYMGNLDVLERLDGMDGENVTLVVTDEPLGSA